MSRPAAELERLSGKRIMIVLAWSVLGGAERSALATARRLHDATRADVHVLSLTETGGRAKELFLSAGFQWHALQTDWHGSRRAKARELVSLTRRLWRMRPAVLLPYTSRPNILCGLVWRATGASLCVWNQQDVVRSAKFGRRVTARAVRQTPLFIANSQTAAGFLISELGADSSRVQVVLEGTDLPELGGREESRARLGIDDGIPVVSMLAHLHAVKDHATLLRAWRIVLDRLGDRPPVLLLAGRPSGTEDAVKALAFDLDLGNTVRFLGDVEDVRAVLAASDVAVLSSLSESAPKALIESMAAGLPVAATDIPAVREIVGVEQEPYLAPPGDSEQLARAILELLAQPRLRERLAHDNRLAALDRASSDGTGATIELIARALASREASGFSRVRLRR